MFDTVWGVDYSGAALSGRTLWLARLAGLDADRPTLDTLAPIARLDGVAERDAVNRALVARIVDSTRAAWALGFPFAFPVEVMRRGCDWDGQFRYLASWGEQAYASGVALFERGLALGGPGHRRRATDTLERTTHDSYHYRIIYQTFYGMRDVLGPLRQRRDTAILPFHARRLPGAARIVVEASPGSTLRKLGLPFREYKQPLGGPLTTRRRRNRRLILDGLAARVDISPTQRLSLMRDGGADGIDAVAAALGAMRCLREYDHDALGRHPRYRREGRHYA